MENLIKSGTSYAELLTMLRRDLQLDATVDILPGTIAQALGLTSGIATAAWPGGTPLGGVTGVTHNLGTVPRLVVATVVTAGQGAVIACHVGNYTLTTFDVQAEWINYTPAATALPVAWLALR